MGFWEDFLFGAKDKGKRAFSPTANQQGKGQTFARRGVVGPTRTSGAKASPVGGKRVKNYSSNTDRRRIKNTDRFPVNRAQRSQLSSAQKFVPSPNRVDRLTQPNTYMGNPTANTPMIDPMEARIQDILDTLDDSYAPPTIPGGEDFGRGAMLDALNKALGGALGGINSARNMTNSNFQESDRNLADMHAALQGNIRTEGAQNFKGIADSLVQGLQGNQTSGVNELQQMENKDRADRIAMLKNLGIQESGAAPESTVYDEAAADITSRGNISQNLARQDMGTNLAYNEGMAQTAGMQGASRRAALNQQLQNILGQLNIKESDVRNQYNQQVAAAESEAANRRMQWESQNNAMAYEQWQNQQNNLRDTLGMIYENQNSGADREEDRRRWEAEMELQRQQMQMEANEPVMPPKLTGLPGAIGNLANAGFDPAALQMGMRALEQGLAEGAFDRNSNPSDRVVYLTKKGVPTDVAVQLVTSYGNL